MSPVYDCTTESGRAEGVAKAVEAVRDGKVVVLPTDTVYGVGADAFSEDAVAAVLAAKGRGRDMPPPVLVPNVRTVDGLATDVPAWARDLIKEFWPGPLTLVFRAQTSLMWDLGETNGTVALRMPQDEIALELLGEVGPMAVTSANQRASRRPPRSPTPPPSSAPPWPSTSTPARAPTTCPRRSSTARGAPAGPARGRPQRGRPGHRARRPTSRPSPRRGDGAESTRGEPDHSGRTNRVARGPDPTGRRTP